MFFIWMILLIVFSGMVLMDAMPVGLLVVYALALLIGYIIRFMFWHSNGRKFDGDFDFGDSDGGE